MQRACMSIKPPVRRTKPSILSIRRTATSRLFCIESVRLRYENGTQAEYERIANAGSDQRSVIIVPLITRKSVLLVREYAVGLEDYVLGLPQGMAKNSETATEAGNRELMEEVGYAASHLTVLSTLNLSPNCLKYRTDVVLAEGLLPARLVGDEPEPPEVIEWPLAELPTLVGHSDITEARSVAALFLAHAYLHHRQSRTAPVPI